MARASDGRLPRGFGPLVAGVAACMAIAYALHLVVERPFTRSRKTTGAG